MVWFLFTMQTHHQETAAAAESSSSSSNQNTVTESPAAALEGPSGSGWLRPHNQDPDWLRLGLATQDHHQASTSGNIDDDRQQAHQDMAVVLDRRPMITGDGGGEGGGAGSSFVEFGLNIRQPAPGGGAGPSAPVNFQLTSVIPSQFPGAPSTGHAPPRPLQLTSTPDFNAAAGFSFPLVFHQTAKSTQQSQQTAQYWPFGPTVNPQQMQLIPSTAAGPSLGPPAPFGPFLMGFGPPLVPPPVVGSGSSTTSGSDVRFVVDPRPRRPHAGIWFRLLALQNQGREPFLPQVAKSYLRIKDGRMTVGLLIKYLVNKLGLDNESQVEITCRGQPLAPSSTLQHVRDHIWRYSIITTDAQPLPRLRPDEIVTLLPDSSTDDHLMVLHYGRSPSSS